jgi:ABC-type branched-subunit amino acid transport system substrate-binding protein
MMRRAAARTAVTAAVAATGLLGATGCGSSTRNVVSGGAVPGTTRTVYSILDHPGSGAARDMVLGQKLAIAQANGRAGGFGLSFVSLDESTADPRNASQRAGVVAQQAIHDPQIIAVIGGTSSASARTSIPLIDAAGILHLLPGAGYPGFTERWRSPLEPARYHPSGSPRNVVRLVPDDVAQGRALLDAAVRAAHDAHAAHGKTTSGRTTIAVEQEPGLDADALSAAIEIIGNSDRADAVIYAGGDPVNAAGVAQSVTRRGTPIVLPDALVLAGVANRLDRATRKRTILVSSAPAPGSEAVKAITPAFEQAFGRAPGPYAVIGYDAMRAVIAAINRAGPHDHRRQQVTRAFRPPPARGFSAYRADGTPLR